jgi:hypothetical protein
MDEPEFALGRGAVNDLYVHQVLAGGMRQAQVLALVDDQGGYPAVCARRIAFVVYRRSQLLVFGEHGLTALLACLRNGNRLFPGAACDDGTEADLFEHNRE